MTVVIPVAVRVLSSNNADLIRSTSSYLSLAAINNGALLSQYSLQLILSITRGNTSLLRVLPQVYLLFIIHLIFQVYLHNPKPFHAQLTSLLSVMNECDSAEMLSLLQLCSMIANSRSEVGRGIFVFYLN